MILNSFLSGVLLVIAFTHAAWGLGIWLPIRDEAALAKAVVGARNVTRMPGPIPCFLVAAALAILALLVWVPLGVIGSVLKWGAMFVFLFRGLLAFTKQWRKMTPQEPFATLDRRYFGPLCLAIAAGFIIVNIRA